MLRRAEADGRQGAGHLLHRRRQAAPALRVQGPQAPRPRVDATTSPTARGQPIGWFKKHFRASLVNSTWTLGLPDGRECIGQERNAKVAVARRLWDVIPVVGDIPVPLLFHFDFVAPDGSLALSSTKRAGIKDVYRVTLPALADGKPIDWRVGMAMAVALDALQSR